MRLLFDQNLSRKLVKRLVVWLRCGNAPTRQVEALIRSGEEAIQELLDNSVLHCLELH